jgi:hypothetical protein
VPLVEKPLTGDVLGRALREALGSSSDARQKGDEG